MCHCAEALGKTSSLWANPSDLWCTAAYQEERAKYIAWESEMVRSGKLRLVDGCPTALKLGS